MNWISVKDRLPERDVRVLGIDRLKVIEIVSLDEDGFFMTDECFLKRITHWMPLPEPPEVEE